MFPVWGHWDKGYVGAVMKNYPIMGHSRGFGDVTHGKILKNVHAFYPHARVYARMYTCITRIKYTQKHTNTNTQHITTI